MTDTPSTAAAHDAAPLRGPARWFAGWSEERRRNSFLIAYTIAFLITVAAIWLVAVAPGSSGEGARGMASQAVLVILGVIGLAVGLVALFRRMRRRRDRDAVDTSIPEPPDADRVLDGA